MIIDVESYSLARRSKAVLVISTMTKLQAHPYIFHLYQHTTAQQIAHRILDILLRYAYLTSTRLHPSQPIVLDPRPTNEPATDTAYSARYTGIRSGCSYLSSSLSPPGTPVEAWLSWLLETMWNVQLLCEDIPSGIRIYHVDLSGSSITRFITYHSNI